MPSGKLDDYVVVGMIGSGSFGQCKKIRRICDGKVCFVLFYNHLIFFV